ncbi:12532_t:CDS:2 [Funneliformis geosporum]|uniref:12532_t:CDS:1 n=1 Tax=Funneliformis geosporum TaxID=1117311 RepID=A0A9W4WTJ8_9GLOM|nr:12532_t:CDS:2 [Funneliformis geosporum]
MSLQIKAGVDINLLKSLFVNQERILNQEDDTNCNKLYPSGCHQKYCDK